MCVRILQSASQVNGQEWQFFLKGGQVLDRSQQPANPGTAWLSGLAWDSITELDSLPNFKVNSIFQLHSCSTAISGYCHNRTLQLQQQHLCIL